MKMRCGTYSATDEKGTAGELGTGKQWRAGIYRLQYETGSYFQQHGMQALYPHIDVSVTSAFRLFNVQHVEN